MIYFLLAVGLILIVFLSFAVHGLWIKYVNNKMVKVFLLPGTIVHELSHALLCLITGTTIKELNLFSFDNTGIKYDKPKVPGIFDFIIVSAPMFGCAFFIFFISKILSDPIHFKHTLPLEFRLTLDGLLDIIRLLYDAVLLTSHVFQKQFHINNIRHIFYVVAIIIFTVSMAPQKQDIKYLILGFGSLSLILFFLEKFGVHFLKYTWWNFCIKELWVITALTIIVLVFLLFITLIMMGLAKGYSQTFGHKGSGKGPGKVSGKASDKGFADRGANK